MKIALFSPVLAAAALASALVLGCSAAPTESTEGVDDSSEAYTGQTCGTRGAKPCASNEYCRFPQTAQCGMADAPGRCAKKPRFCPHIVHPVCGCDGATYANSCVAASKGVSVAASGACKKACGADGWRPVIDPTMADVQGVWSRDTIAGISETTEVLRLHSDGTYALDRTFGPYCRPNLPCARFATRLSHSEGTFTLGSGTGVQLVPNAPAPDDVALSWSFDVTCKGAKASRLSSTELGVDVQLSREGECRDDADCKAGDAGPNRMMCRINTTPAVVCTDQKTCGWTCKPTDSRCPTGQKACPACGAPPPDGVCTAFVCVPNASDCPLFP